MQKSKIEWTDYTWNPTSGCTKKSKGCIHCYGEALAHRFWGERKFSDVRCHPEKLDEPLKLRKPAKIFVNSMSDLFHQDVPDEFISSVFDVMGRKAAHQVFLILTKRPQRMAEWTAKAYEENGPYPNVWLGVSVEDQTTADERIPLLLQTPAAHRFVSVEPMLGTVDIISSIFRPGVWESAGGSQFSAIKIRGIDWVVAGGETGSGARPMHPDWVKSLRDQCVGARVPFFFKSWGEWKHIMDNHEPGRRLWEHVGKKASGHLIDGVEWRQFPEGL